MDGLGYSLDATPPSGRLASRTPSIRAAPEVRAEASGMWPSPPWLLRCVRWSSRLLRRLHPSRGVGAKIVFNRQPQCDCVWIRTANRAEGHVRHIALLIVCAISGIYCVTPSLQLHGCFSLSIKFIKGHILLHIMCFIFLTQTYYAPGWRWPYESHKAGLVNVIVKAGARSEGKVIR